MINAIYEALHPVMEAGLSFKYKCTGNDNIVEIEFDRFDGKPIVMTVSPNKNAMFEVSVWLNLGVNEHKIAEAIYYYGLTHVFDENAWLLDRYKEMLCHYGIDYILNKNAWFNGYERQITETICSHGLTHVLNKEAYLLEGYKGTVHNFFDGCYVGEVKDNGSSISVRKDDLKTAIEFVLKPVLYQYNQYNGQCRAVREYPEDLTAAIREAGMTYKVHDNEIEIQLPENNLEENVLLFITKKDNNQYSFRVYCGTNHYYYDDVYGFFKNCPVGEHTDNEILVSVSDLKQAIEFSLKPVSYEYRDSEIFAIR